ncbi:purine-cytosine permease-like protein [Streptomyces canus]|uniref:Purine-cytosine permease-like protein n=1 Tax=Streptomyces canus TaxID=58343 RepID=A0AAW8FC97_9ACTN|nr:purine-cytosine permease-like protein [Streptomyces canus]
MTMGAGLSVSYGLDFWQTLVVGVTAPIVSYGLVGLIGIAGKRGGAPGMALSRAVFGQRGNLLPGALIWVTLYTVLPKPAVAEPAGRTTERVDAVI